MMTELKEAAVSSPGRSVFILFIIFLYLLWSLAVCSQGATKLC